MLRIITRYIFKRSSALAGMFTYLSPNIVIM